MGVKKRTANTVNFFQIRDVTSVLAPASLVCRKALELWSSSLQRSKLENSANKHFYRSRSLHPFPSFAPGATVFHRRCLVGSAVCTRFPFGEEPQHFAIEGGNIRRLPARNPVPVANDFLIPPLTAGVANVVLDRVIRGVRPFTRPADTRSHGP